MIERTVDIQIKGKTYKIKTDLENSEIKEIEEMVNNTLSRCEKLIEHPEGAGKVYTLALLSTMESLLKERQKRKRIEERLTTLTNRIEEIL